jgi:hypothetical protein
MAHIVIHSDTRILAIPVVQSEDGDTTGRCPRCGRAIGLDETFEDAIESIGIHADKAAC